jgi:heme-degrading monooxygenase HmoA
LAQKGEVMPFVSITRLRVRRWRYLPQFLVQSIRAARQAKRAAGNLAVSILRDADRAFWTRTVWSDEAAMRSFMQSGVHRRVMARLPEWCDEAALVHWVQDDTEPPSWPEAHRRLQQEGRRSRVSHPSEAQRRFEIREPRTSATA